MSRRALPKPPVRYVDGYVRVSRVGKRKGPRFISPEIQKDAILRWGRQPQFALLEVFEEMDESGARPDRPQLERVIQRIEAGGSSGLVVWRVDRFGRSLMDGLRFIERVGKAGGTFYSVQEGLDTSTDAGRLALRILLSVAEFRLDGVREGWDEARERAIRRGIHVSYLTPPGYRKTRAGRLYPVPMTGAVMTEFFRRRAAGATLLVCSDFLAERGVRTAKGNPRFSTAALSKLLRSRVYLGEVHSGRFVNAAAHPPLIDPVTWEAAQHPPSLGVHHTGPALLSGLVRCASCRHVMTARWVRPRGRHEYRVYGCRKLHAAGFCSGPAFIMATTLEPFVIDAVLKLLASRRRPARARMAAAESQVQLAAQALQRYRDNDRIATVIGDEAFLAGLELRQNRLREATLAVIDLRARNKTHDLPPVGIVRRSIDDLDIPERRALIAKVIDVAFVAPGRRRPEQRITICPAGTAPHRMPYPGCRGRGVTPIQPRRDWINPQGIKR